jgi:hypothetical protein
MSHDDPFEAQVRIALGEHAGDVPHVDLADRALSRARAIRRRRTALLAAAALATVAVAVPVGLQVTGEAGPPDHTASPPTTENGPVVLPRPVPVAIGDLVPGGPPRVPYIDDATMVDADGGEHPVLADRGKVLTDAAALKESVLVFQKDTATGETSYTTDGRATDLPDSASVTPPAIDQGDTKAAVFALHDADASGRPAKTDTIVYATALNGGATTVDTGMHVRQVMGA